MVDKKTALILEKCQENEEKPYTHQEDPGSSPRWGKPSSTTHNNTVTAYRKNMWKKAWEKSKLPFKNHILKPVNQIHIANQQRIKLFLFIGIF